MSQQTIIDPTDGLPNQPIEKLTVNTLRTLSMDAVQAANSGHPGTPNGTVTRDVHGVTARVVSCPRWNCSTGRIRPTATTFYHRR